MGSSAGAVRILFCPAGVRSKVMGTLWMSRALALAGALLLVGCGGSDENGGVPQGAKPPDGPRILSMSRFNAGWSIGRCAYGASAVGTCGFTLACDKSALPPAGAGDITITDGSQSLVYRLQNGYYSTDQVTPGWATTALEISAPGAAIPGFSLTTPAPVTHTVTAPEKNLMHPVGQPLEVAWTGEPTALQILEYGTHDGVGGKKTRSCLLDGALRSYTLTPEDLAFIGPADDDVQICIQAIATSSVTEGDWLFEASERTSGICRNVMLVP